MSVVCHICEEPITDLHAANFIENGKKVGGFYCDIVLCRTCALLYESEIERGFQAFADWLDKKEKP